MKRAYKKPKAVHVDFHYDVQVKAASGDVALYGDPQQIGRCQQSSATECTVFWETDWTTCKITPFSLRS